MSGADGCSCPTDILPGHQLGQDVLLHLRDIAEVVVRDVQQQVGAVAGDRVQQRLQRDGLQRG